jgi:hypothetical protein
MPCLRHQSSTMGRNTATTAVLLIKPEMGPTIPPMIRIWRLARVPPQAINQRLTDCTAPVRSIPALRINMASTVIVAELLKPEMPSSGVTRPRVMSMTMTVMAVTSAGNHSPTKQTRASSTTPRVKRMVMAGLPPRG